jgi:hypothetical protein
MLAEPNGFRHPVLEAHHAVFPVTDMIPHHLVKHSGPQINGIEIHIERIYGPISMVIHDDGA